MQGRAGRGKLCRMSRASILAEALQLPVEERAKLASELIAAVEVEAPEDAAVVEQAWADELEARIARADANPDEGIAWDDLHAELSVK
jgi:putative addiction module component (TIGR02574 family)